MKFSFFATIFASALCCSALRFPVKRASVQRRGSLLKVRPQVKAVSTGGDDVNLGTVNDMLYIANISVGGVEYPVQLDTGSSDLWIKGPSFPLPNVTLTSTSYNLTYGIGWASGNVSTAEVQIAGITIPSQALLSVSSAINPALQYGAEGVLGLGFTSLSLIDHLINGTGGSWGRSLLYNAFLDNPSEPNYITFALERSDDPKDDTVGAFTIGEVDPTYSAISNSPSVPTWPPSSPNRWTVLLDGFIVGTTSVSVTSLVPGVSVSKAIVLLDSGSSYSYVPPEVAQAIYGSIPGAAYDPNAQQWNVPCNAEVDMAVQIGGQVYPIHPLDVSPISLVDQTKCSGSFIPQAVSTNDGEYDWLLGDNFLRSVYSMFDFGDFDSNGKMGDPYVKLLSIVDPNEASSQFVAIRGGTARNNITYNASTGSGSGATSVTLASDVASKLNKLITYIPVVLGILALNALALMIVAVAVLCYLFKKRKSNRGKKGRNVIPLHARAPTPYPGAMMSPDDSHEYEQVSVMVPGEPEDMPFTPPGIPEAVKSYDGDTLRPLNSLSKMKDTRRPFSTFSTATGGGLPIPGGEYRVSAAPSDVTAFVPPSPPFKKGGDDRPKSIA